MIPQSATHIDNQGRYWRVCPNTRHWELCKEGVWVQDDSAEELYPIGEAPPNEITHSYRESYGETL